MSRSLSQQLLLGFSLSLAVVGITTLWLNHRAVKEDLERQTKSRAQSIARSLEFATEGLLEFGNQSILDRMVQNFATLPAVHKVIIMDPEGKIIADNKIFGIESDYVTKVPQISKAIIHSAESGTEVDLRTRLQNRLWNREAIVYILPFASRLFRDGGRRGVVIIILDSEQIQQDAWRIFLISTQTMIFGIIVILTFMVILLRRTVLHPLSKLNQAISQSHQTGEIRLPPNLPDNEIQFLADTLIQAVQQLRHYERTKNEELRVINGELEHLSTFLEQKVLERTQELLVANQELEAAKESALAGSRAKTAFFANMSHELRTPLNAVLGFTQLVLYAPDTPEVIKEQLDIVNRSGEHLLSLINTVLELAKIESGKQGLTIHDFYLSILLNTVREIIAHYACKKNLELIFDLGMNLPDVFCGDEMKLKQILVNLLHNAIKFTDQGQVILRVRLEQDSPQNKSAQEPNSDHDQDHNRDDSEPAQARLCFIVEDTGIGIKSEDLDHIFDDFFRASGESMVREGTGLGLAITRKFIRLMGGDITVSSTLGRGTIFNFFIPITLAEEIIPDTELSNRANKEDSHIQDLASSSLSSSTPNPFATTSKDIPRASSENLDPADQDINESVDKGSDKNDIATAPATQKSIKIKSIKILLAEDNLINQKLMLKMLSRLGYTADVAVNGIEVLEALRHQRYDLILMDIQMPLMDGLAATLQINQEWAAAERPVIVAVTANVMEEDRKTYLAAGMKDYIAKPINITLLQNVLQRLYSDAQNQQAQ